MTTRKDREADLTSLLVGATIIEVGFDWDSEVDTLLVADKEGNVHKLECAATYEDTFLSVTKGVGKKA